LHKRLSFGKISPHLLQHVLRRRGVDLPEVVLGPQLGVDFAAVRVGGGFLITSADPITGASERPGWYAVNVSANDVATSGVRPRYVEAVVLHPESASGQSVLATADEIDEAANTLEMAVVGGHTEVTPGLERIIVSATSFGFGHHYVTAADAQDTDAIVMTKSVALEGTAILATRFAKRLSVPLATLRRARMLSRQLSVVRDAKEAFSAGSVHAMHDPTEGGLLGGIYEMACAAGLGFFLDEQAVPIASETRAICNELEVDPLRLISSGVLLVALAQSDSQPLVDRLRRASIPAAQIGTFTSKGMRVRTRAGHIVRHAGPVVDELWKLLGREGQASTRSIRSSEAFTKA
jgi:hydrogenase maturation factor